MATLRNAIFVIFMVVRGISAHTIKEEYHPMSDEFIDMINSKQNFWKAGRNFHKDTPMSYFKKLMGVRKDDKPVNLPTAKYDAEIFSDLFPLRDFDARDKWPNCPSMNEIRDQGSCGSDWALAAVASMTDRYCIFSNQTKQFHFSAQDLLSCSDAGSCSDGSIYVAWTHWQTYGIVSGGNYNSSEGCMPYEIPMCDHYSNSSDLPPCTDSGETPKCCKSCDLSYNVEYEKDKKYGKTAYIIPAGQMFMKGELLNTGPFEVSFEVYSDFLHYKEGVYKHTAGEPLGYHAVKLLGWGIEENGIRYWTCANSWNEHWGDKGFFKILRGDNHCGIEVSSGCGVPYI